MPQATQSVENIAAPNDEPALMGEVARVLGMHRVTAFNLARAGLLPAVKRGGRYEMTRADLERERAARERTLEPAA